MSFLQKISPAWPLRLGLGITFLYTGYSIFTYPKGWYWAIYPLPQFVQGLINQIGIDTYLRIQGGVEIVLALVILAWFLPRWTLRLASLLVTLELASILLFIGIRLDTFRDIGLVGAAAALFLLSMQ